MKGVFNSMRPYYRMYRLYYANHDFVDLLEMEYFRLTRACSFLIVVYNLSRVDVLLTIIGNTSVVSMSVDLAEILIN